MAISRSLPRWTFTPLALCVVGNSDEPDPRRALNAASWREAISITSASLAGSAAAESRRQRSATGPEISTGHYLHVGHAAVLLDDLLDLARADEKPGKAHRVARRVS
jgi:hypothetical protein